MMKCIYDMETEDPDDAMTLCLLAGHPLVDLMAVTITPGTPYQVGVVRHLLNKLGKDIPVGVFKGDALKRSVSQWHYNTFGDIPPSLKRSVSQWHYNTFGDIPPSFDFDEGWEVLDKYYTPDVTLITGANLKNLGALLDHTDKTFGRLFVQGGFAGDGVVPIGNILEKFRGKVYCPTYNLNGDIPSAKKVIASNRFLSKNFVSKNVCHGVIYDKHMHDHVKSITPKHPGLDLIIEGMEVYLAKKPDGKKFHDPLAAMCALNPDIGQWAKVDLVYEKGGWGSFLNPDSNLEIIVGYDHDMFLKTMCNKR